MYCKALQSLGAQLSESLALPTPIPTPNFERIHTHARPICLATTSCQVFYKLRLAEFIFGHGGRVELATHSGDVVAGRTYCHQRGVSGGEVSHVWKTHVRSFR
ncbi:hypothetical protein JHK87_039701 [Glycine soja]|nr:hypothetical protein JHK87_039701 [Glycine soja]